MAGLVAGTYAAGGKAAGQFSRAFSTGYQLSPLS